MPITAINREVLELFNSLLHDLYFEIPPDGFRVQEEQVCILLTDKDHCIHKDIVARYQLYIESVINVENRGSLNSLPGNEVELNEIQFKNGQVILKCVHPFQLLCEVSELRLSLDQLYDEAEDGAAGGAAVPCKP